MGFYDILQQQAASNPLNAELDSAIEMFIEKFGKAPLLSIDTSFTYEKLIKALKEAVECGDPGSFGE